MAKFRDRLEAAQLLASKLEKFRGQSPLVLGIPRGGVPMAARIAESLGGELNVALARKIPFLGQPELALGALAEGGEPVWNDESAESALSPLEREALAEEQREIIAIRRRAWAPWLKLEDPRGRVVIVVDDGLATGATMLAALNSLKQRGAKLLVAAAAVASPESLLRLSLPADELVILEAPKYFSAVGQFFKDFMPVPNQDVVQALRLAQP
jgi:putative phosphoribosyl transferase